MVDTVTGAGEAGAMPDVIAALLDLWTTGLPADDDEATAAFARLYTDPVPVNGSPLGCRELVARARALHAAFADIGLELVDRLDSEAGVAATIRQTGRLVGPLATPLGEVAPTGEAYSVLSIDVLHVGPDGRISAVWVLADDLGRLVQTGVLPGA